MYIVRGWGGEGEDVWQNIYEQNNKWAFMYFSWNLSKVFRKYEKLLFYILNFDSVFIIAFH